LSDHTSLTIVIPIAEEHINSKKCSIIKDNKEELAFIKDLTLSIKYINTSNMSDITSLDRAVVVATTRPMSNRSTNGKFHRRDI